MTRYVIVDSCSSPLVTKRLSKCGSAQRKLLIVDAADELNDLRVPPGNRPDKLRGDRAGQYSIRINQQWRICFRWTDAGPEDASIVDYH